MKKKLCCILMIIILLLNSSIMVLISEAIETAKNENEKQKIKALAEINLTKYDNYNTITDDGKGGDKGVLVQFNFKTGIEFAEDVEYKPLKETTTNIALPWIGNFVPSRVEVIIKSTQATNGKKDAKYTYHSSTGILSITAENSDYTQRVDNARDEYEIICIYRSECYTENQENNLRVELSTKETLDDKENTTITARLEEKYTCKDNISGVISTEHQTGDIYDGYIKANKLNSENKYETSYNERLKIMVSNKDIAPKIEVKEFSEIALYTDASIDKEKILDILGDKGSIDILDESANIIKTINKDSETDENGKIKFTYENRIKNLTIQLNDIEKEGIIEILNTRIIEPTAEIINNTITTQVEIKGINTITTQTKDEEGKEITQTEDVTKYERQEQNDVQIKSAVSNIDLKLTNNAFANVKPNNTDIRLTLRMDNPKYSLFKNPNISIEMPKEMESVDIGTPEIMYDNNTFEVVSSNVATNDNGNKVINIQLQGEQTTYNKTSLIKGVNIVIPTTISLTKILENKTQNIKCTYSNEMTGTTESTEKEVTLLNKIVNNDMNLYQATTEDKTPTITVTKDISAGNKKEIYERQVQKITLTVKNNTNTDIANINLQDEIPTEFIYASVVGDQGNLNDYVEDEKITIYQNKIEKLKANETTKFEYYVRIKQSQEIQGKTVTSKATATIDGNTEKFESNTIENTIKESKFQIDMVATTNTDGLYTAGTKIKYKIVAKNITNETLTGVTITSVIPEEATFSEALYLKYDEEAKCYVREYSDEYINKNYEESKKNVIWDIGTLEAGKEAGVMVEIELNEIQDNKDTRIVTTTASVKAENTQEYISNKEEIIELNKGKGQVKLETNLKDKYVYEGDEFQYIATVTNTGNITIDDAILVDELPKGIKGLEANYCVQGGIEQTLTISQEANLSFSLEPGETFTAKISVLADELADGVEKLEVKNFVKVSSYSINEMTSNEIVNVILKKASSPSEDPSNPTNPDNPTDNPTDDPSDNPSDNPTTPDVSKDGYNISGTAWLDENQNGCREENEKLVSGMQVNLYYESGEIAKDSNGKKITTTTGDDGKYIFSNLKQGDYVVAFLYDNNEYTTTEYQKNGVSENVNSDALETQIEENDEEKTVGLTDTISLTNTDALNIDIGLIKNGIFDLKLEKTISKVIVQNSKKTKTYEFANQKSKTSKVEIDRKTANSTTIVVEYKISVTNEGEVAGYAQEIVDYMPEEFEFNSELNSDWYLMDENLTSTSLSETLIKPGETASLNLVLTKKLTEDDFTTITNTAEISEDYNEKLISDIDSTPGNEDEDEDDMSSASLIIAVGTGTAVTYTTFVIIMICIIGFGIYIIKKNILGKEENNE